MSKHSRNNDESRLVFSTDQGRIKEDKKPKDSVPETDGVVRVRPEKKGRGGKTVTVITGLPMSGNDLKGFAKQLKKRCGGGGAVKDGAIELQGDHVDTMVAELVKQGYNAKRSGG
ncbi:stress response translation initiation inhibitor YciH [Sansalvadorimonas sp. 2012CJ34-2]|uniref:Stress response translation initiation inhibitor YciH n=1 Tax=Parendozoicomonas callyspongiae TaxID=2942213 RepID=A0ABT0PK65_9GAMM|nr:stress response translation initiation inhibitor YciH [Sansalvadorimonas sp. 2012CJ34-2]MCL6271782.1 stress response translation initiation inhibitor YciH [Sansalvadorimonas sp. 2012CJ34-2]